MSLERGMAMSEVEKRINNGVLLGNLIESSIIKPTINKDEEITFITMADVSEQSRIISPSLKKMFEIKPGFTFFAKNDILLAKITPCFENGKGCFLGNITTRYGFGSTEFLVLRTKNNICPEYVFQISLWEYFRLKMKSLMTGSAGQQRVSFKDVLEFELPFNHSLEQQQYIAKILTTCDKVIEQTEAAIAKYKAIKQGMLHDLFTRGLDKNGKLRPTPSEVPDLYKESELGLIPKDWEVNTINNTCEIINGGTPSTSIKEYWEGNIPWLSVEDFNTGHRFVLNAKKNITIKGLEVSSTNLLKKGMLIISARGTVGVISQLAKDMAFNQSCYGLNSKDQSISNDYIYYYLCFFRLEYGFNSFGSVFNTITRDFFNSMAIAYPCQGIEIYKIVNTLTSIDNKILQEEKVLEKYKSIKKGLMKQLLHRR